MSNKVFLVQIYTLLSFYDVGYKKHSIFSNVLVHQDTPRIIKMLRFSSIFKETLFHEKKSIFIILEILSNSYGDWIPSF